MKKLINRGVILLFVFFLFINRIHTKPGKGSVDIQGKLEKWGLVTLTLDGPFAKEQDNDPNPFLDYLLITEFKHKNGKSIEVQGYFACDGNGAETSADKGNKWRVHFSPDKTGQWSYNIQLLQADKIAAEQQKRKDAKVIHSVKGEFNIKPSTSKGRLQYVGERYLKYSESGEYFLKAGADAPETLLAYADFDGTTAHNPDKGPLKHYKPHIRDWKPGDPVWKKNKGKGLIGAINYLSSTGANVFSFLPYNAGGDGDNVWPHLSRSDKIHFDCSKLDQWGIVFAHGAKKGMYLHFKLQETENDDSKGKGADQSLNGGDLGIERKLYLRELIARFAHFPALNWNLGEENTQTTAQQKDMIEFIRKIDPYDNNIVVHTFPNKQDSIYGALLGDKEALTGVSIQNSDVAASHKDALKWVTRSEESGHSWVVAVDEPGNAITGTPPDPDFPGMTNVKITPRKNKKNPNKKPQKVKLPTIDEVRLQVLWGVLMAGGTGIEYYFGYSLPENDLKAENWRSRDKSWAYCNIALKFFKEHKIPFHKMHNRNDLINNPDNNNSMYCFAKEKELYLVFLAEKETTELNLTDAADNYTIQWFNPRKGGKLQYGSVKKISGGKTIGIGFPPKDKDKDWLAIIKKK